MHPVAILLLAVGIVLVGILVLRLHAFLALLLAAFTVATLTPAEQLRSYAAEQVEGDEWTPSQAEAFVRSNPADRVAEGFGDTATGIGILIAMAAIIGKCLLESGSADRIVRSTLAVVGQARASLAFLGSGFVLAIPVFFDTVFYLLMPLGKAMWLRTRRNYLLYVLSIVAGATMAHSLVPPTPGPLLVADELNVSILTMAAAGCLVGLVAATAGYGFAIFLNHRMHIPLRDSSDLSMADLERLSRRPDSELPPLWLALAPIVLPFLLIAADTALATYVQGLRDQPAPAWFVASGATMRFLGDTNVALTIPATATLETLANNPPVPDWAVAIGPTMRTLGDKNVALTIAAAVALATLAWKARVDRRALAATVGSALAGGGVIILITSAGGAFGAMVRQGGVSESVEALAGGRSVLAILPIAFLVTALIRSAQGSATVAMITAVGVLGPLAQSTDLGFHPVYLALAIGCGSKPVAWMADSGFWVICQMSGLTEAEGLKTVSPLTVVMGLAGLAATMIGAAMLPMG